MNQNAEQQVVNDIFKEIQTIIDGINDQMYFSDEDIEEELKLQLEKLDDEKKQLKVQDLHKILSHPVLNRPYFQKIYNTQNEASEKRIKEYQDRYKDNLEKKQIELVIKELQNEQYCKANLIPEQFNKYIVVLEKLERQTKNSYLIFELIEIVKEKDEYNFLSILKILIQLFLIECDNDIKVEIHQLIGSLLVDCVYQLESFLLQIKNQNKPQFQNVEECILKVQSKDINYQQEKDELIKKWNNTSIVFLFELFTLKLGSHYNNVVEFMKNLINVKNINREDLIMYVSMTENFNDSLDYLYFKLIFYFWIQFSEKFEIKQNIEDLEIRLSKSNKKQELLNKYTKHMKSKNSNIIYRYVINKIIQYSNQHDEEFNQSFKQNQTQEQEMIEQYKKLTSKQIKELLNSNLNEVQNITKKMMFYQISKPQGIQNQLISFLTFLATNKLDDQTKSILEQIVNKKYQLEISKQNYLNKLQKINLLHLQQVLQGKGQLKMSKFVHQTEIFENYPKQLKIQMEDFNISLTSQEDIQENVSNWLKNKKDKENFKKLIPYYFNIIKRGESSEFLLALINNKVIKNQSNQNDTLNLKSLFQILYNNSDLELQVMLLKLHSKHYPVPLLYQNPILENVNSILDYYVLNEKIFYLLSDDYPIINFSLSRQQNQFGKSELINIIFYDDYKGQKFEIRDSSKINNYSVDCQFDFSFNGCRNYLIADVHGRLEDEVLEKMLPFFKLWIIQMQTDDEFEENLNKSIELFEKIEKENKPKIVLIVRDSQKKKLNLEKVKNLQLENDIKTYQIQNFQQQENKAYQKDELTKIKEFILNIVDPHNQNVNEVQLQDSFLKMCQRFKFKDNEIQKCQTIFKRLKVELKEISNQPDGFYSIEAFPFRHIVWRMQSLKKERQNLNYQQNQYQQELEKKQNAIDELTNEANSEQKQIINQKEKDKQEIQKKIQQVQQKQKQVNDDIDKLEEIKLNQKFEDSTLIKLFSDVFSQEMFYVTYLGFVEHIARFSKQNLKQINKDIEEVKSKLNTIKVEQKQENEILEDQLQHLEQKFQNQIISIELFWREVIKGNKSFSANLINQVCKLIKKGEPFEFLSGCNLRIEYDFLLKLKDELLDKNDKILILSILGPQSSGKSTLLNKIFGCHFLTSMGRCTRGLYLQLLKISNKKQFEDLFDYILILDSEGLQNPNQQDTEFDKRISLFLISISDILIFNVKGEIHSTFHSLIQVCFYTLAKFQKEKCLKQFTWCFNQNSQGNQDERFKLLKQIEDIGGQLNCEKDIIDEQNKGVDFKKYLDIEKDNIYILGMATVSSEWQKYNSKNQNFLYSQEINQQDFSKNALSFGKQLIAKFTSKQQKQTNHEIINWTTFINKVKEYWEIVSKLPDLVEFSDLKEQKEYEALIKQVKKHMQNTNNQLQDYNILLQVIEAKCQHNQNLNDYNLSEKEIQKNFSSECNNKKEEVLNCLQQEYSYQIIKDTIIKKAENKIELDYQLINLEGSLIILQKIHSYKRKFQQNQFLNQISTKAQKIKSDPVQLKNLNNNQLAITFEKIWDELIKSSNQQIEDLHKEFQRKLFECFQESNKHYSYKSDDLESHIEYFVNHINKLDPKQNKENEMEIISQRFIPDFEQSSFQPINRQSKCKYQKIFYDNIQKRLDDMPQNPFIDPRNYLEEDITNTVISKQKLLDEFKDYLKQVSNKINEKKADNSTKCDVQNHFTTLNQLNIQYDEKVLSKFIAQIDSVVKEARAKLLSNGQFYQNYYQSRLESQFRSQNHQTSLISQNINSQNLINSVKNPISQQNSIYIQKQLIFNNPISNQNSNYIQRQPIVNNPISNQNSNQIQRQHIGNNPIFLHINPKSNINHNNNQIQCQPIDELISSLRIKQFPPNPIGQYHLTVIFQQFPQLNQYKEHKKKMTQEDNQNYFIIEQNKQIKYKLSDKQPKLKTFFEYIISQKSNQISQKEFFEQYPDVFREIMRENKGWEELCSKIYDIIQQQFEQQQQQYKQEYIPRSQDIMLMNEDMTQYKEFLKPIINNVDNIIEETNKQLAFFGVQFTPLSIRKLQFYSFFIIWRFICYDKLKIYDQEQKNLQKNKEKIKQQFIDSIEQEHQNTISKQAQSQADKIYEECIRQFYNKYQKDANDIVNSFQKNSFELIKELDQQLLISSQNNKNLTENQIDQIYQYLSNQTDFIKKHVEQQIKIIQDRIKNQFLLKSYISKILNLIKKNISLLQEKVLKVQNDNKIKFQDISIYDHNTEVIQSNQILQFILGQNVEKLDQFKYKEIFSKDNNITQIEIIVGQIQNMSSVPLNFFQLFLDKFITRIETLCEQCQKLETNILEFQLTGLLQEIKNTMNGCDKMCPMCRRKCDSDIYQEKDHKHKCSNGHQLRGMTGVLIRSTPSLFTCEEIVDETEIQMKENRQFKTWKEIKKIYSDWSFKDILSSEQLEENKLKFIEIWNGGIGELVCQNLSSQLNQKVHYQKKHDLPMHLQHNPIHYIFILDYSGSMQNYWNSVQQCVKSQLEQISSKQNARVSVILFNNEAKIVIDCQKLNIEEQLKLLVYQGGGTSFSPAFKSALKLIKDNREYSYSVILFYTDGLANYPKEEMMEFDKLENQTKDTIYFLACSQPSQDSSLQLILDAFKTNCAYAEWRNKIEPSNLNKNWTEMISSTDLSKYKA